MIALSVLATSFPAIAQDESNSTNNDSNWNTMYLQYGILGFSGDNGDNMDAINGFTIGYNKALSISSQSPLYVELGVALTYATGTTQEDHYDREETNQKDYWSNITHKEETKTTMVYAKIPISLTYNYQISHSGFSIAPYLGVTGRFNFSGESKQTTTEIDITKWSAAYGGDTETKTTSEESKWDLFDEDDMGEDNTWSRFLFGWQVGVNVKYKHLLVGIQYGSDFSEIAEKIKTNNLSFSLGYCF